MTSIVDCVLNVSSRTSKLDNFSENKVFFVKRDRLLPKKKEKNTKHLFWNRQKIPREKSLTDELDEEITSI